MPGSPGGRTGFRGVDLVCCPEFGQIVQDKLVGVQVDGLALPLTILGNKPATQGEAGSHGDAGTIVLPGWPDHGNDLKGGLMTAPSNRRLQDFASDFRLWLSTYEHAHRVASEPGRYRHLYRVVFELRQKSQSLRLLEIGTWYGNRACDLWSFWKFLGGHSAEYVGIDLFERLTEQLRAEELSKPGSAPRGGEVFKRLKNVPWDRLRLFQGDTRVILPYLVRGVIGPFDLVFVDGGHSLGTIQNDWECIAPWVRRGTVALLDDYYEDRDDYGCRPLTHRLLQDPAWCVTILDPVDGPFGPKHLRVRMVEVRSCR